jgi:hypothetical protein
MLTHRQLAELAEAAQDVHVLNVYASLRETDAVARRAWREHQVREIGRIRKQLATAPHGERAEFDRCAERLAALAAEVNDEGEPRGWVALISAERALYSETIDPAPTPLVEWRMGVAVAPYARLLRSDRPLILAMVDSRSAKLYSCAGGRLAHVDSIHAHTHTVEAVHMGNAPREHFHSGTRGETTRDAAQHAEQSGREHLLRHLTERLGELAGAKGWIVLGGTPMASLAALNELPAQLQRRVIIGEGLSIEATEAEMLTAAAKSELKLRSAEERSSVAEIVERSAAGGRAVLHLAPTLHAIEEGAAQLVLVTPGFGLNQPDDAELLTRAALTHGAEVVELSPSAAAALEQSGAEVGALLRYAPQSAVAAG